MIDEVYTFCESVGLPTTLAAINLQDASDEALAKAASIACAEKETVHNEPMTVTPASVIAAIKIADEEGQRRTTL